MVTHRRPASELVAQSLRSFIRESGYDVGAQLPPEPELSERMGTSRATLREALRLLVDEGMIRRVHGVGTFVRRTSSIRNSLHINFGVSQLIDAQGMEPGTRELRMVVERPSEHVAQALALAPADEVFALERVRTANGDPVVYSLDYIPRRLVGSAPLFVGESVYRFLVEYAGCTIAQGEAELRPDLASGRVAEALAVDDGELLFVIEQTDYDEDGEPVLHSIEWHAARAFTFRVIRQGPAIAPDRPAPITDVAQKEPAP